MELFKVNKIETLQARSDKALDVIGKMVFDLEQINDEISDNIIANSLKMEELRLQNVLASQISKKNESKLAKLKDLIG